MEPTTSPGTGAHIIGTLLDSVGRPARIDSEYYLAKLRHSDEVLGSEESTGTDQSLLFTCRKIHFVGADDASGTPEDEQLEMYLKYPGLLTNLMDESRRRKAPVPVRAPAQICVAAVVAAELIRRGASPDTLMVLVERLLEQLEYATAYYLDAEEAGRCATMGEMLELLRRKVSEAGEGKDGPLVASASLVLAFANILHGLIGRGDLNRTLALVDQHGADGLWHFLGHGYRFFGLPPVICTILQQTLDAA